jgi:hypothetical protein
VNIDKHAIEKYIGLGFWFGISTSNLQGHPMPFLHSSTFPQVCVLTRLLMNFHVGIVSQQQTVEIYCVLGRAGIEVNP